MRVRLSSNFSSSLFYSTGFELTLIKVSPVSLRTNKALQVRIKVVYPSFDIWLELGTLDTQLFYPVIQFLLSKSSEHPTVKRKIFLVKPLNSHLLSPLCA